MEHSSEKVLLLKTAEELVKNLTLLECELRSGISKPDLVSGYIQFCLKSDILTVAVLRDWIREYLAGKARLNLSSLKKPSGGNELYPDHTQSPQALAYGIHHRVFTAEQIGQIQFDHSETAETFMKGSATTLVDDLVKQLVPPPVLAAAT